ncbi:Pvc16 family protein [Microbacterium terricola]|uniref:Pvc16 N-terminal domain-containing protein n=1 Tax=Microbacterium terricola TaxID=344163 RepID=A0ABM8E0T7_9MICO|nr:Pvc16 family protein [Microbacterium terricola]UYK40709.1 Pvc16 family protein [Microbacterium terricola]BDV31554.1 hypothetical protein Microterr_22140 [Microbacterium terricola]
MIPAVDSMLRTVLERAAGTPPTLIGFQPPDGSWAQRVKNFRVNGDPITCLNAYLTDIRENRRLRTNAVAHERALGVTTEIHAPLRVDLHYLISAWYPSPDSDSVPATPLEHELLSRVIARIAQTRFNSDELLTAAQAAVIPDAMRSVDLPLTLLPVEGFPHLGEFWSAMGGQTPSWRPSCYVIVTMPVAPEPTVVTGIVETVFADLLLGVGADAVALPSERIHAFGGTVSSGTAAVPGATVRVIGAVGTATDGLDVELTADAAGRFAVSGLPAGEYTLRVAHPSHPTPPPVAVVLPLAGGHIDLDL